MLLEFGHLLIIQIARMKLKGFVIDHIKCLAQSGVPSRLGQNILPALSSQGIFRDSFLWGQDQPSTFIPN